MKSSLKTFLVGKNPYVSKKGKNICIKLRGSCWLDFAVEDDPVEGTFYVGETIWMIDVLDDGTAITHCVD
jgi:hypothetical protein